MNYETYTLCFTCTSAILDLQKISNQFTSGNDPGVTGVNGPKDLLFCYFFWRKENLPIKKNFAS